MAENFWSDLLVTLIGTFLGVVAAQLLANHFASRARLRDARVRATLLRPELAEELTALLDDVVTALYILNRSGFPAQFETPLDAEALLIAHRKYVELGGVELDVMAIAPHIERANKAIIAFRDVVLNEDEQSMLRILQTFPPHPLMVECVVALQKLRKHLEALADVVDPTIRDRVKAQVAAFTAQADYL